MRYRLIIACLFCAATASADDDLLVAVASNFAPLASELAAEFTASTGIAVRVSAGATGRLYAQIVNGAPYDIFLAADVERPQRLLASGHAVEGSAFTYARGRLLLWSGDRALAGEDCAAALRADDTARLAIANPKLAPYGRAARAWLEGQGLFESWSGRLVVGENIAQTLQFAVHGGARFALLAASQAEALPEGGCRQLIDGDEHPPVDQQAVLLTHSRNKAAARRFLDFLRQDARPRIAAAGYEVVDD